MSKKGYGVVKLKGGRGSQRQAHRVIYELLRGPIPDGLQLDHLCRNRPCVNPSHMEPVTGKVNIARGRRWQSEKTHCPQGHEYTPENTYFDGTGGRRCRQCNRDRSKQNWKTKKATITREAP